MVDDVFSTTCWSRLYLPLKRTASRVMTYAGECYPVSYSLWFADRSKESEENTRNHESPLEIFQIHSRSSMRYYFHLNSVSSKKATRCSAGFGPQEVVIDQRTAFSNLCCAWREWLGTSVGRSCGSSLTKVLANRRPPPLSLSPFGGTAQSATILRCSVSNAIPVSGFPLPLSPTLSFEL